MATTKKTFGIGDLVLATPKPNDLFQNEFAGTITGEHTGAVTGEHYWMVEDGEGETFDCTEDQITHVED